MSQNNFGSSPAQSGNNQDPKSFDSFKNLPQDPISGVNPGGTRNSQSPTQKGGSRSQDPLTLSGQSPAPQDSSKQFNNRGIDSIDANVGSRNNINSLSNSLLNNFLGFGFGTQLNQSAQSAEREQSSQRNGFQNLNNLSRSSRSGVDNGNSFDRSEDKKSLKNRLSSDPRLPRNSADNNKTKPRPAGITYEEIGLFPRSFSRVFDRFFKQIFSDVENLVIQEYRFYRYLFLTTIKTLCILFFVPLLVNFVAKTYLIRPITEYFWNTQQTEIFLNSYEQKRAFSELHEFEEKLYFDSLLLSKNAIVSSPFVNSSSFVNYNPLRGERPNSYMQSGFENLEDPTGERINNLSQVRSADPGKNVMSDVSSTKLLSFSAQPYSNAQSSLVDSRLANNSTLSTTVAISEKNNLSATGNLSMPLAEETRNQVLPEGLITQSTSAAELQEKILELAIRYNNHSIESITNFFADFISLITLLYLLVSLEIQINITKSFLLEVFFGLDDSKKSLLILIMTDLLVGYHSSNLWELFFQFIFNHYGIPESQTGIFLLVATLPVLLDVLFKYLIFRHLNRSSPATVATYHAIIE